MRTPCGNRAAASQASEVCQKVNMLITSQKEFKQATSRLRKELRALPTTEGLSHAQCLELLAKAMGATGYAELAPRLPAQSPAAAVSSQPRYPLRNLHGLLDLVDATQESARVVTGLDFADMQGTIEDIRGCLADVSGARRAPDGRLTPVYESETDVNWDGQVTRLNQQGQALWQSEGGDVFSEDQCILVPEDFHPDDEDAGFDLPNREVLLLAYLNLAQERGIVTQLHQQVSQVKLDSPLLRKLAETIGFGLHRGELTSLEAMLRSRG